MRFAGCPALSIREALAEMLHGIMENMKVSSKIVASWLVVAGLTVAMAATAAGAAGASPTGLPVLQRPSLVFPPMCSQISSLDRLVVKRIVTIPQNHVHFSFPATMTVSDPVAVQKAARATCGLPVMPHRVMSCPADLGISYRLTFYQQAVPYPRVVVDATGCQSVTGLSQIRWVARTPNFWHELGQVMGLKNPSWPTFRGSGGAG